MKWIYQEVHDAKGIAIEAGQKPALCFRGRKYMICIAAGHPVRVLKRAVKDFDKARVVMMGKREYPLDKAIKQFTDIGERNGITEAAKKLLARVNGNGVNENEFQDEEGVTTMASETKATETTAEQAAVDADGKSEVKQPRKRRPRGEAKGPSKISQMVEYMKAELAAVGGDPAKVDKKWRKALFERAAQKFELALPTATAQWHRQVVHNMGISGKLPKVAK
jgi:hypothetical protein